MAKGFNQHKEHMVALSALGRPLARRSGSKCEFCDQGNRSLSVYEVSPAPSDPDPERCIFMCEECKNGLDDKRNLDVNAWRFLENSAWSDLAPVQVRAVRQLRRIVNNKDAHWAREFLENLYLEEEIEQWIDQSPEECK